MEEKLDKIIELLEKQNKILDGLRFTQTTNKFPIQQPKGAPGRTGVPGIGVAADDIRSAISKAREEAEERVRQTMKNLDIQQEGLNGG